MNFFVYFLFIFGAYLILLYILFWTNFLFYIYLYSYFGSRTFILSKMAFFKSVK